MDAKLTALHRYFGYTSFAVLGEMAKKRPKNRVELLSISGVGEVKARRYGEAFIQVIREHTSL